MVLNARVEQTTKTKTFNHDNDYDGINSLHLPAYEEPVFSPDRHTETTHTKANVEVAKHSEADKILSHDLTVKDESLIEENLLPQLRELIENFLCGGNRIDGDIVIEIDSIEKTLKILPQSSLVKGELEGNYFRFIFSHLFFLFHFFSVYSVLSSFASF